MTYTAKFTKLKDFNPAQLEKEVDGLDLSGGYTVCFMGFAEKDEDTVEPADLTRSRVVVTIPSTEPISIISEAMKGDVHVLSKVKFTAQQVTDIEEKLDAHNSMTQSPRQLAEAQTQTDLSTLQSKMVGSGITVADLNLIARLLLGTLVRNMNQ